MILLYTLPLAALTYLGLLLRLAAGSWSWAVPQVALAGVLVAARHSSASRLRWTALCAGLVAGLPFGGSWLLPAAVLLLLGSLARRTARLVTLRGWLGLLVLGSVFAFLQLLLLSLLGGSSHLFAWTADEFSSVPLGLLLSGLCFALLELWVRHLWPLRHLLERP